MFLHIKFGLLIGYPTARLVRQQLALRATGAGHGVRPHGFSSPCRGHTARFRSGSRREVTIGHANNDTHHTDWSHSQSPASPANRTVTWRTMPRGLLPLRTRAFVVRVLRCSPGPPTRNGA